MLAVFVTDFDEICLVVDPVEILGHPVNDNGHGRFQLFKDALLFGTITERKKKNGNTIFLLSGQSYEILHFRIFVRNFGSTY